MNSLTKLVKTVALVTNSNSFIDSVEPTSLARAASIMCWTRDFAGANLNSDNYQFLIFDMENW